MRRMRKDATTKVWHNPELNTFAKRAGGGQGGVARVPEAAEDRRSDKRNRAALEALFAPKRDPEPEDASKTKSPGPAKANGRSIVLAVPTQVDPRTAERQKLLHKLLNAEGRPSVSKAADAFISAGFTFPEEQDVYLQLLEHGNEEHVRGAIAMLNRILAGELPKRRAMLESRLRRIEQFAEDPSTRAAAEHLRRRVSGRANPPAAQ